MRAFAGLDFAAITMLIIAVLNLEMFKIKTSQEMAAWRLTRVAMTHSHLMASEYEQEEIGVVEPLQLRMLESLGYDVSAALYDPESGEIVWETGWKEMFLYDEFSEVFGTGAAEDWWEDYWQEQTKDGMGMPVSAVGYDEVTLMENRVRYARFALPVVYGSEKKYGLLFVSLESKEQPEEGETVEWFETYSKAYQGASQMFVGEWGES